MQGPDRPPAASGVEVVDRALRTFKRQLGERPLPPLLLARHLGDVVELDFAEPVTHSPPDGIAAVDEATWAVPVHPASEDAATAPPPFIGLTALGTGCHGTMFLLDLTTARPLVVTSVGEYAAQVLRALSLDLVRNPWTSDVRLHLVGIGAELASARPDRVYYAEHLGLAVETITHECWDKTTQPEPSARQARTGPVSSRGVHVVLVVHPTERYRRGLAELVRRYPHVTAIVADTHPCNDLDTSAHLDADRSRLYARDASWVVTPRRVDASDYPHAVAGLPPPHGSTTAERRAARPVPVRDETPRLEIRLLGPPEITGLDTGATSQRHLNQTVQVVTYLALHPGATAARIGQQLAVDAREPASEVHARISRARRLLGSEHLPHVERDQGYELRGVRIDRDDFYRLVNRSRARAPLSAATDLEQALALVRGRPLDGGHGRFTWAMAEAEQYLRDILDACHALAQLYLDLNQPRAAWNTARIALGLDDRHPLGTQDLFRSLHALGEYNQLYQARDHYDKLCADHGLTPDRATLDLAHQLLHPAR